MLSLRRARVFRTLFGAKRAFSRRNGRALLERKQAVYLVRRLFERPISERRRKGRQTVNARSDRDVVFWRVLPRFFPAFFAVLRRDSKAFSWRRERVDFCGGCFEPRVSAVCARNASVRTDVEKNKLISALFSYFFLFLVFYFFVVFCSCLNFFSCRFSLYRSSLSNEKADKNT